MNPQKNALCSFNDCESQSLAKFDSCLSMNVMFKSIETVTLDIRLIQPMKLDSSILWDAQRFDELRVRPRTDTKLYCA